MLWFSTPEVSKEAGRAAGVGERRVAARLLQSVPPESKRGAREKIGPGKSQRNATGGKGLVGDE